ncbi:MAG: class I SAM-dependent methyltransferase [Chloroflexota bacterium]
MVSGSGATAPDFSVEQAQRFAQHVAPTLVAVARRAVDLAEIQPGQTVLDVATATGLAAFLAAERAERDGTVIGLDASPALLAVAQQRATSVGYGHIRWQQGDPAGLTFADEAFDVVLCLQALMTFPRPDIVLEEARRVLVEGGRLVLTTWGARAENEWIGLVERALRRAIPPPLPALPFRLAQPGNLEALLQAAGFEDVEGGRMLDRLRFQGADGLWEWVTATREWGPTLATIPADAQQRACEALSSLLAGRLRNGEVAIGREIIYVRAIAPAGD